MPRALSLNTSFDGANRDVCPFLPAYINYSSYVSCKLGKTLVEAFDFFEDQVHRSDMFRDCIMEQANK